MSRSLAEGLRRALALGALSPVEGDDEAVGVLLLAPDNSLARINPAGERWLAELPSEQPLPPVVTAVASRARDIVDGEAKRGATARARVQAACGRWLVVRGSALDEGLTVVMLEPARPHELAPLIADAYPRTSGAPPA